MQQLEIEVLYNVRCETAASMFDLRDVVAYIAKRVGLMHGRVWFGAGNAVNLMLAVVIIAVRLGQEVTKARPGRNGNWRWSVRPNSISVTAGDNETITADRIPTRPGSAPPWRTPPPPRRNASAWSQ